MDKREYEQRVNERSEWQHEFVMCGNGRWHRKGESCDCTDSVYDR